MLFKNPETNATVVLEQFGLTVPPGAVVEIDDAYCEPQIAQNGSKMPSVLDDLCGGKHPFEPYSEEEVTQVVRAKQASKNRVVPAKNLPAGVRAILGKDQD